MTVVSYKNVKRPIVPVGDLPMLALFARGEQGAWYDPSDLYNYLQSGPPTMFQDAAGAIPVTSVEQPVGLILDKSRNGNHASQLTAPARPRLSARVNLFSITEGPLASLATSGAPVGVVDADVPIEGFDSSYRFGDNSIQRSLYLSRLYPDAGTTTLSVYVQMDDGDIPVYGVDFRFYVKGTPYNSGATVMHVRDAIYRVSMTTTGEGSFTGIQKPATYSSRGFRVAGFQFEFGSKATKYQATRGAANYDWQGWPLYLYRDGVDDKLVGVVPEPLDSRVYLAGAAARLDQGTGNGFGIRATNLGFNFFLYWGSLLRASARLYSPFIGTPVRFGAGIGEGLVAEVLPRNSAGQLECQMDASLDTEESTMPPGGFGGSRSTVEIGIGTTPSDRTYGYVALWRNPDAKERSTVRKFLTEKMKLPA